MTPKIIAVSDLHGELPAIPECDLLLLGGDYMINSLIPDQFEHLRKMKDWLHAQPAKEVVAVAGNHDWIFQDAFDLVKSLQMPWHYLCDSGVELFGIHIWGSPWQPVFFDWAFNLDEPELEKKWALIPEKTDILLLHGPPYQCLDKTVRNNLTGSPSLRRRIERLQPRAVICGHIHESFGQDYIGRSSIYNVSLMDEKYRPVNAPTEIHLG